MTNKNMSQVRQEKTTYIVDYDLPADNIRRRFYRSMERYRRDHGMEKTGKSTQSVIITQDEKFAHFIHGEALAVGGKASIWRATRVV